MCACVFLCAFACRCCFSAPAVVFDTPYHSVFAWVNTVRARIQIKFSEMFVVVETQFSYRLKCNIIASCVFTNIWKALCIDTFISIFHVDTCRCMYYVCTQRSECIVYCSNFISVYMYWCFRSMRLCMDASAYMGGDFVTLSIYIWHTHPHPYQRSGSKSLCMWCGCVCNVEVWIVWVGED